jgi:transposase InsO family protein
LAQGRLSLLLALEVAPNGRATADRNGAARVAAPASPWQNGFAEPLIGSIRRECVDHIIVLGEKHLRPVLKSYADYYKCVRTHRSLNKDAPVSRPVQRTGVISSRAIPGGLHHHYARV